MCCLLTINNLWCIFFCLQELFPASSSDPTTLEATLWSFHNLIEINTDGTNVGTTIIPSNVLLQLKKLERINLRKCYRVQEVFEVVALEGKKSQTVVSIPNFREMNLKSLNDLQCLWKSNQWMILEFPKLTTVSIEYCNKLKHVFTCSMVSSLVQLKDLEIRFCENIEVIVKEDEEEESDTKVNEIMLLPRLKSLKLKYLRRLKGFCLGKEAFSLPALDTLQIIYCPAVTVFTKRHLFTPELKIIHTDFGICYIKTDINSFIKTKQGEVRTYMIACLLLARLLHENIMN